MVNRKDAVKSPEVLQHLSLCAPDPRSIIGVLHVRESGEFF